MLILTLLLVAACSFNGARCTLTECGNKQIKYSYTECDQDGKRWMVSVPVKTDVCKISKPNPPMEGIPCDFSCKSGEFLHVETQKCRKCPIGTYSLGSGVRFDSWNEIPEGFHLTSESVSFEEYGYHSKMGSCATSLWKASKDYIRSNNDDCTSSLSYAVKLKTAGFVRFEYQYTDDDMLFHFYVRNGQCQIFHSDSRNVFLNTTETSWASYTANLEAGDNILFWKTTGILVGKKTSVQPVMIRSMEVSGVSYSANCLDCREGYYSNVTGSKTCKPCPVNTHSDQGAVKCSKCDPETEYAPAMSSDCIPRPACKQSDYFETHSACDKNNQYTLNYMWLQPKICRDDLPDSVHLPISKDNSKECSPCNPGYYPTDENTCEKCAPSYFSDGNEQCKSCPANTSPNYGYYYMSWDRLPENVKISCLSAVDGGCSKDKIGWYPIGNGMKTAAGQHGSAYLLFMITASTYKGILYTSKQNKNPVYGKVTFAFEMQCATDNCQLFFMKEDSDVGTIMLKSWQGTHDKTTYTEEITQNSAVTYTWAFQKTSETSPVILDKIAGDNAIIYSVNITNVDDGVADSCKTCVNTGQNSECIGCERGSYIDSKTNKCVQCQEGYVLKERSEDVTHCTKCGKGVTHNKEHTACEQKCFYTSEISGRKYNFTALGTPVHAATPPLFSDSGRKYFHSYNFSLCGNDGFGTAHCISNVSSAKKGFVKDDNDAPDENVIGMMCRSTQSYSDFGGTPVAIHTNPILLANEIDHISHNAESSVFLRESKHGMNDVIFVMKNVEEKAGQDCINGSFVKIHLRCDSRVENVEVSMPANCPDGTCEGCEFNFLWRSVEACPICTKEDYTGIQGSCQDGEITTTYVWKTFPKDCKYGVDLPENEVRNCTPVKLYVEIGVLCGLFVLLIFLIVMYRLWKRSKRLEYKYHRLMNSGGKNGSELPVADSCAMSESEEEEGNNEEVMFQKKRARILGDKPINSYDSVALKPMTQGV